MFGLPYLGKYINSVVKEQPVADAVDWLNYYVTAIMLATFSVCISAKQYFGSPIQCWMPKEFSGGWERYCKLFLSKSLGHFNDVVETSNHRSPDNS